MSLALALILTVNGVPPVTQSDVYRLTQEYRARIVDEIDLDQPNARGFTIYVGKKRVADYAFAQIVARVAGIPAPPWMVELYEPEWPRNRSSFLLGIGIGGTLTIAGLLFVLTAFPPAVIGALVTLVPVGGIVLIGTLIYGVLTDVPRPAAQPCLDRNGAEDLVAKYNSAMRRRLWVPPSSEPQPESPPLMPPDDYVLGPIYGVVALRF